MERSLETVRPVGMTREERAIVLERARHAHRVDSPKVAAEVLLVALEQLAAEADAIEDEVQVHEMRAPAGASALAKVLRCAAYALPMRGLIMSKSVDELAAWLAMHARLSGGAS